MFTHKVLDYFYDYTLMFHFLQQLFNLKLGNLTSLTVPAFKYTSYYKAIKHNSYHYNRKVVTLTKQLEGVTSKSRWAFRGMMCQ